MENIVSNIICTTFDNEIKRWQTKNEKQFAMQVSFSLSLDYDKEEGYRHLDIGYRHLDIGYRHLDIGYRHLDILIYGPMNYVGVLVRERWTIIPVDEIADEDSLKEGCKYRESDTGWLLASYHDSCWTSDGVQSTIFKNRHRINCLSTRFNEWYKKIEMTPELLERFNKITSNDRVRDNYYEVGKNVLKFV